MSYSTFPARSPSSQSEPDLGNTFASPVVAAATSDSDIRLQTVESISTRMVTDIIQSSLSTVEQKKVNGGTHNSAAEAWSGPETEQALPGSALPPQRPDSPKDELSRKAKENELKMIYVVNVQLTALKALSTIMSCGKYAEMMLVPSELVSTPNSIVENMEMKTIVRSVMKHMVKKAVQTSTIKRNIAVVDIERAFSIVFKLIVQGQAEEETDIHAFQGISEL